MQLKAIGQLLARVGTAFALASGACALMAAGTAQAAVTSHKLSGIETQISCLSSSSCVAVGERGNRGSVITLKNGTQSHTATLRGSSLIYSVSCPSKSGCWAIGDPKSGAGAYLVKINSAGRVTSARTIGVPAGADLGRISCSSMSSCEVVGTDIFVSPTAIEIGTWNGSKLHVYRVKGVKGGVALSMEGISCWHADCEAVGDVLAGSSEHGLILTTRNGRPGKLHKASDYSLYGVSCVSASRCYAAGYRAASPAGLVVTVSGGVAGHLQTTAGDLFGIECAGSKCVAAGEVLNTEPPASQIYDGVLLTLSGGTATGSPQVVAASGGYSGIASRGGRGFISIGAPPSGSGTEVTSG